VKEGGWGGHLEDRQRMEIEIDALREGHEKHAVSV
jgi:hypothetical protein